MSQPSAPGSAGISLPPVVVSVDVPVDATQAFDRFVLDLGRW
jgi:hypothetical protein